jgi:hypothetical protein
MFRKLCTSHKTRSDKFGVTELAQKTGHRCDTFGGSPSVVIPNTEIGVWLGGVRVVFTEAQLIAMVEQAA